MVPDDLGLVQFLEAVDEPLKRLVEFHEREANRCRDALWPSRLADAVLHDRQAATGRKLRAQAKALRERLFAIRETEAGA